MSRLAGILDRLDAEPGYVCEFCGKTYDENRLNCHACGFEVVQQHQ